ncbi:MAG: 7-carboxy-7-deazaguanine synthase QueE [Bacteroidota bacterium]
MSAGDNGQFLPLIDRFYSIQGEGFHTGKPAYFIRIGGCDIGCHWCDTKISWNEDFHEMVSIEEITRTAGSYPARSLVVTGGEPTLYNLTPLTSLLKKKKILCYLETSGNHQIRGEWSWVCLSPKQIHPPVKENYLLADELKVIISEEKDIAFAESEGLKVRKGCHLFLQPEWSRFRSVLPVIVEYVKMNPAWNISLQSHKFMNIP